MDISTGGSSSEAATGGVLRKIMFLKLSQISRENTCVGVFLNKVAVLKS